MYIASIEDYEFFNEKINFWKNVYGVDMSNMTKWNMIEPLVHNINKRQINSDSCCIMVL
jgi:protein arginine N-methyltransferase 1